MYTASGNTASAEESQCATEFNLCLLNLYVVLKIWIFILTLRVGPETGPLQTSVYRREPMIFLGS